MAQHDYEAIGENDSITTQHPNGKRITWKSRIIKIISSISPWQTVGFMLMLGTIAILWTMPSILSTYNSIDYHSSIFHCGESPAEAITRGCNFDIMSFAWLPTPCFDRELMEEFLGLRQWTWYTDKDGQTVASELNIREGKYNEIFVSWEYHLVHCTYMWRKMHRALLQGGLDAVDGYIGSLHHTEHCSNMLLGYRDAVNVLNTFIYVKYPACGRGAYQLDGVGYYRVVDGNKSFSIPTHDEFAPF